MSACREEEKQRPREGDTPEVHRKKDTEEDTDLEDHGRPGQCYNELKCHSRQTRTAPTQTLMGPRPNRLFSKWYWYIR